jgi:hypothetical protein
VYDAIKIEEKKKPVVALINQGFLSVVESTISSQGGPDIRRVVESIPCECTVMADIMSGVSIISDEIVNNLAKPLTEDEKFPKIRETEKTSRVCFQGNIEEVNHYLYRRGWTDGLPVVPPTESAVTEMLKGTDLPPDHLVAEILPRKGKATIEKIAVNAVMAGCLPTYLPVLIAAVKVLAEPETTIGTWGVSTGSWAPFWIINGPVRLDLNINRSSGTLSPGDIANATIGRALGLIIKNIGGIRKAVEDMGCLGNPGKYSLVMAENEEESPWEPLHVEYGFSREDSTVGVAFPNTYTQMQPYGSDDKSILRTLMYNLMPAVSNGSYSLILAPAIAKTLAASGWTKKDIKKFIAENNRRSACELGTFWSAQSTGLFAEKIPLIASDSVPLLKRPELMRIIVAGGVGVFMGQLIGSGVSPDQKTIKKIEFPHNWNSLVRKYQNLVPIYAKY